MAIRTKILGLFLSLGLIMSMTARAEELLEATPVSTTFDYLIDDAIPAGFAGAVAGDLFILTTLSTFAIIPVFSLVSVGCISVPVAAVVVTTFFMTAGIGYTIRTVVRDTYAEPGEGQVVGGLVGNGFKYGGRLVVLYAINPALAGAYFGTELLIGDTVRGGVNGALYEYFRKDNIADIKNERHADLAKRIVSIETLDGVLEGVVKRIAAATFIPALNAQVIRLQSIATAAAFAAAQKKLEDAYATQRSKFIAEKGLAGSGIGILVTVSIKTIGTYYDEEIKGGIRSALRFFFPKNAVQNGTDVEVQKLKDEI